MKHPARWIDVAIQERVFGDRGDRLPLRWPTCYADGPHEEEWVTHLGDREGERFAIPPGPAGRARYRYGRRVPPYSTSVAAALRVVGRLAEADRDAAFARALAAVVGDPGGRVLAGEADLLHALFFGEILGALAICRAALAVADEEEGE